jgi:hypothetical protein
MFLHTQIGIILFSMNCINVLSDKSTFVENEKANFFKIFRNIQIANYKKELQSKEENEAIEDSNDESLNKFVVEVDEFAENLFSELIFRTMLYMIFVQKGERESDTFFGGKPDQAEQTTTAPENEVNFVKVFQAFLQTEAYLFSNDKHFKDK